MDERRGVHLDRWAEIDAFREAMRENGGVMPEGVPDLDVSAL